MKKYWIKLAGCAATAVVIFLIILGMVDLHTDGILVRDSYCIIRPNDMATYRMDVQGATNIAGTQVQLMRDVDGANQAFHIQYVGDDQYKIGYGNEELCTPVASDKETVVIQGYDSENEYNKWNISRIGTTQNYLFTNVATGNTLCYEYSSELASYRLYVKEYDEASENFAFFLVR